jgi:uncharacterized protein (DUF486 family)
MSPFVTPVVLLIASNVFMTFAWYGHLKYPASALWIAVLASWGIAFFEYWLAVPANRIGAAVYAPAQLKAIQEVITLVVFAAFSRSTSATPSGRASTSASASSRSARSLSSAERGQRAPPAGERRRTRPLSSSVRR